MITREDIIRTVREDFKEEVEEWPVEEWEFDKGHAENILRYLDIKDPGERVKMYNRSHLDLDDLVALANVEFRIVECAMCHEKVFQVEPGNWSMFQGIDTNGEIGPVEINGKEKQICSWCYDDPIFW